MENGRLRLLLMNSETLLHSVMESNAYLRQQNAKVESEQLRLEQELQDRDLDEEASLWDVLVQRTQGRHALDDHSRRDEVCLLHTHTHTHTLSLSLSQKHTHRVPSCP